MNSCTEHIILYAKNWYGHSGNVIEDLRKILGEVTGTTAELMSESDIHECLASAFSECVVVISESSVRDCILNMTGWKWKNGNIEFTRTPEESIIGMLSVVSPDDIKFVEGKTIDKSRMVNVRFGDKIKELEVVETS